MWPAVLLILGPICFVTVNGLTCPPPEDIAPCICAHDNVFCHTSTTTTRDLERAMKTLTGRGSFALSLRDLNLGNLSLATFKNLSTSEMAITDCKLDSILDDNMKQGYALGNDLKVLKIMNSINDTKRNFKMEIISLRSLVNLEITHNVIRNLRSEIFDLTPKTVSKLTLNYNRIETIAGGAFRKFTLLKTLELNDNRIQNITRSILPGSLYSMDLGSNNISSLPTDLFWNMPFLKSVSVYINKITEFPETTWSPVWSQLDSLHAFSNPLICDTRIDWMFKVRGPRFLMGICESPPSRRFKGLWELIEENGKYSIKKLLLRMKSNAVNLRRNNQTFVYE